MELTFNLKRENACLQSAKFGSNELHTKGCSSNKAADERFSGFLCKHRLKKSFPSDDKDSGIGGDLLNMLNIACP